MAVSALSLRAGFVQGLLKGFGIDIKRYTPVSDWREVLLYHARSQGIHTVIDVGANLGQFAIELFGAGWDRRILSVEPLPDAHAGLVARAAGNKLWSIAPRCAVGDSAGETTINISENSVSSSILGATSKLASIAPQAKVIGQAPVEVLTLREVLDRDEEVEAPFLLKMDVQGFEGRVLAGARDVMPRIKIIYTEMSLEPIYDGELNFAELSSKILDAGFRCVAIYPGYANFDEREMSQIDAIFLAQ